MMRRRNGFTLIELLVVIAIIGILAAMVFPVFARARESARKAVCLSNVKNIALAIQMYLGDYDDCMPPREHRQEVMDWYYAAAESAGSSTGCAENSAISNNPYLKWQVILDEYIRNRDVWKCPSQRAFYEVSVLNPYAGTAGGDWWARAQEIGVCPGGFGCHNQYPPGWGGTVTDSAGQYQCFEGFSYTSLSANRDLKTSQIGDPARWLAVIEVIHDATWSLFNIAYPDVCKLGCASCDWGPGADWVNCPWSQDCGAGDTRFGTDVAYRKTWARHLGGVNLGFMDGHAAWMASEAVMTAGPDERYWVNETRDPSQMGLLPLGLCMMPDL